MIGCRPLEPEEISNIIEYFDNQEELDQDKRLHLAQRNKTIFLMGLYTGFRISELLSLKIKDVFSFNKISDYCSLQKKNTKKKVAGRITKLNDKAKTILQNYFEYYRLDLKDPDDALFFSSRDGRKLCSRRFQDVLAQCFHNLELNGKLGTHSLRKTFAKRVYDGVDGSLLELKQALGHSNIDSTAKYVAFNNEKLNDVVNALDFTTPENPPQ